LYSKCTDCRININWHIYLSFFSPLETEDFGTELIFVSKDEDTKGVIRSRKSKKDRQHNGRKDKQRSTKHYTENKDRATQKPLKTGDELGCFGRVNSSCSECFGTELIFVSKDHLQTILAKFGFN
jgi:hypothetical protein